MTTAVPWWREESPAGEPVARHTVAVPARLRKAVMLAAAGYGTRPSAVAAAAHVRVIALLAGETEVATGLYDAASGRLGALRLTVEGSWRSLVRAVEDAASTAPALTSTPESVFAPAAADLSATAARVGAPLWVQLQHGGGRWYLHLYHRTDRIDTRYADRLGGYLVRALRAALDADTTVDGADLLSPRERRAQVTGIGAGRRRTLPDRRPHELFAALARRSPDRVALIHSGRRFRYRELDHAADRVAHALLDQGLRAGETVAVVADRGFDWAAAVVGILAAGGVFLPIDTDCPPARMDSIVGQSGCRLALAQAGVQPPVERVLRLGALPAAAPGRAAAGHVGADQPAYVYFTSGSTGQPKGAMCEHLGMLNHLQAKIDDLGLGPDDVVVQSAQASFDISLWQLFAPLLVRASTLVVDRETVTDVARFVDEIVSNGATVLQVVPSYLEVLLHYLEPRPRALGRLRWLSVTGEAVPRSLVVRWLARYPTIGLVNAYGATEASDDTTHELMFAPPAGDLVPVGRPVGNVTVLVLEPDRDRLVPLGTVGEIAFSGCCVGRGYVNDPSRTAEAFGADPFRPGQRMYRTGDFGRWLPSGSIELHGRRDEQLKIRGHRIELGEVEARLVAHPGVRAVRVVATPGSDGDKRLTAFYTGDAEVGDGQLAEWAAAQLVAAAVPERFHRIDALPLSANGKVDTRALAALAQSLPASAGDPHRPDCAGWSATERRIAEAWARALRREVDGISADDGFLALGGTSLAALRVVASLDGALSLPDLLQAPTLRELAARVDGAERRP